MEVKGINSRTYWNFTVTKNTNLFLSELASKNFVDKLTNKIRCNKKTKNKRCMCYILQSYSANFLNSDWIFWNQMTNCWSSYFFCDATALLGPRPPHCRGFEIKHRQTTAGGTPLEDDPSPRLYLTTYDIRNRQPCSRRDSKPQSRQASGRGSTRLRGLWDRR
jgi:hypothetical protein